MRFLHDACYRIKTLIQYCDNKNKTFLLRISFIYKIIIQNKKNVLPMYLKIIIHPSPIKNLK